MKNTTVEEIIKQSVEEDNEEKTELLAIKKTKNKNKKVLR